MRRETAPTAASMLVNAISSPFDGVPPRISRLAGRRRTKHPIRFHDLRATFATLALAAGRSETSVADRTGHRSSIMINRYRRAARTATELNLGELMLPRNSGSSEPRFARAPAHPEEAR